MGCEQIGWRALALALVLVSPWAARAQEPAMTPDAFARTLAQLSQQIGGGEPDRVPVVRPHIAWTVRWVEKKGPKCIRGTSVVAAALADENSIDFLMRDRRRIRAKMDSDCPALDFYGGFYLQPEDDRICARREEIRNRMGASCRIDRFRVMVPTAVK